MITVATVTRALRSLPTLLLAAACGDVGEPSPYEWRIPEHFPQPLVPGGSAPSEARVELGRHLFYEERLSTTGDVSCASCHRPELAFSDDRATSVGADGHPGIRNAPSLANVAYQPSLTWGNPLVTTLEAHALVPLFVDHPLELGAQHVIDHELDRMAHDEYRARFAAAFPDEDDPFTIVSVTIALASFQRTLVSGDSAYDRFLRGDDDALGESASRGLALFESPRLGCARCHEGLLLGSPMRSTDDPDVRPRFAITGLVSIDANGVLAADPGLYEFTHDPRDLGRHRVPSLRNVALTAPYMHDGSIEDLEGVIAHYAAGGRATLDQPGEPLVPAPDPLVTGFELSDAERADLIAFLEALTDESFLSEPRLSDPDPIP